MGAGMNDPVAYCTHCDGGGSCFRDSDDCDPRTGRYATIRTACRYCDEGNVYPLDEDGEPIIDAPDYHIPNNLRPS